jgi:hypothetical protein
VSFCSGTVWKVGDHENRAQRAPRDPLRDASENELLVPVSPVGPDHRDVGLRLPLDGDDVVVVYDEQTTDLFQIMVGIDVRGAPAGGDATFPGSAGDFIPAEPPPLAPGLTEPVPPPVPDDMHQLRIVRLD